MARNATSAQAARHNRRFGVHQMDLFGDSVAGGTIGAPAWRELPRDAQATLVSLLTQLMLEHARVIAGTAKAEAGHDR
jgi:hypothetical protein